MDENALMGVLDSATALRLRRMTGSESWTMTRGRVWHQIDEKHPVFGRFYAPREGGSLSTGGGLGDEASQDMG